MKYKLFIKKYSLFANDYITEEREIETNDLYHEIGKIYCTSLEDIKDIRYYKIDEKKELQDRIDKAIEYIEKWQGYQHTNGSTYEELRNLKAILKGEQ